MDVTAVARSRRLRGDGGFDLFELPCDVPDPGDGLIGWLLLVVAVVVVLLVLVPILLFGIELIILGVALAARDHRPGLGRARGRTRAVSRA